MGAHACEAAASPTSPASPSSPTSDTSLDLAPCALSSASAVAQARAELAQVRLELQASLAARDTLVAELHAARVHGAEVQKRLERSERLRAKMRATRPRDTPAERTMRRAFAAKVEQLALTHARTTARMLNVQKRCFEEELETLEGEAQATCIAFERQFAELREEFTAKEEEHAREREAAYAKTAAVMAAVKKRFEKMDAYVRTVEAQRDSAVAAARERHALLEEVARRRSMLENAGKMYEAARRDSVRKNGIIEHLQQEVAQLGEQVKALRVDNKQLKEQIPADSRKRIVSERLHRTCKLSEPRDAKRLGELFASVITDFANGQSDSSGDDENEAQRNEMEKGQGKENEEERGGKTVRMGTPGVRPNEMVELAGATQSG